MALGELASAHPAAGSFGVYGELYLSPFAGFLARAGYWIGLALNLGAEMVAVGTPTLAPKRSATMGLAFNRCFRQLSIDVLSVVDRLTQ
jgi:amino acid transporter